MSLNAQGYFNALRSYLNTTEYEVTDSRHTLSNFFHWPGPPKYPAMTQKAAPSWIPVSSKYASITSPARLAPRVAV